MQIVGIVNEVLHDLLGHVQTLAILLTALIAADFFVFTPTVSSSVVREYRVNPSTVTSAYRTAGEPVPAVVQTTLSDLVNRSIPVEQPATVASGGGSASLHGVQAAAAPTATVSGVYPLADLCSRSRATVESVFASACAAGLQPELPLYDRALLHHDEEAGSPLDVRQLRAAIARLATALFARATVTLTNASRSTAEHVNIVNPDGYSLKAGVLPASLPAGGTSDFRFESEPGALGSTQGAMVTDPAFTVKWDPTGPLDPEFTIAVVIAGVALLVVLVLLDAIGAIEKRGVSTNRPEPRPSDQAD